MESEPVTSLTSPEAGVTPPLPPLLLFPVGHVDLLEDAVRGTIIFCPSSRRQTIRGAGLPFFQINPIDILLILNSLLLDYDESYL